MIEIHIEKKLRSSSGEMQLNPDIRIREGEFITLFGPSGSGKTTTLRILAGLTSPDRGFIKTFGEIWLDTTRKIEKPVQERKLGFVFQDPALFSNMDVKENLKFALDKKQKKDIIYEIMEVMDLTGVQHLKPGKLSGGQKQRVALARALVRQPRILLLDEPLSSLDHDMRWKLQDYIIKIHRSYNLTTILVSHDVAEVYKMSDKVIMLNNGAVTAQGSPEEIFSNRPTSMKFQFIGEVLKVEAENFVRIVSVLIGNQIVKVIAMEEDLHGIRTGEKVFVSSKAFNPVIRKIQ